MSNLFPVVEKDFISEKFMNILRERRKEKNFTQEKLADILGVTIKTYRSWEKGAMPKTTELYNLANVLQCDTDYLLGRMTNETHIEKYIENNFSLSKQAFKKLSLLDFYCKNSKDDEKKKMSKDISHILEFLISTEEGNFLLDLIRNYVFSDNCYKHSQIALLFGKERHTVLNSEKLAILKSIEESLETMKNWLAQFRRAKFVSYYKNSD